MPTFYGAVDLVKNELRNAVVQNLASAPSAPNRGQLWFDSANNALMWHNGTAWVSAAGASPGDTVSTQAVGDAAAGGSSALYSRADHLHAMPAFGAVTGQFDYGTSSNNGTAVTISRSDHNHGTPGHTAAAHALMLGNVTALTAFGVASDNGTATTWSRSDHVHGSPAHNNAAHSTIPISALGMATGSVNFGAQPLTNVATPTAASDGANKSYVDNLVQGLDAKASVRAATTANITLSGTQTIDGISVAAGNRVLVKNQTAASANGIYVVATGAWTRALDMDSWAEVPGAFTFVEEGNTQSDTGWVSTADQGGTLGTTAITWTQFSGAGSIQPGAGLSKTGNVMAVVAGTGINVNGGVAVDTAVIADRTWVGQQITGMARKFAAALTGTAGSEVITHNLNTRDVQVSVVNGNSPWQAVEVDWEATSVNTVTIRYNPNLGAGFRAVVVG